MLGLINSANESEFKKVPLDFHACWISLDKVFGQGWVGRNVHNELSESIPKVDLFSKLLSLLLVNVNDFHLVLFFGI